MADIREKEQQQNTDFEKNYIDENIKADQDRKAKAFIKKFMKRKTAVLGLIVIVVLVIIAIIGPYITPYDYTAYDYMNTLAGPSPEHLFGTDQYGRDILSRMLVGTRLTLGVSLSAVVIGAALGTVLGLLAGYYGGVIEMLVMRGSDVLFSFPDILLAIAIVAILGPGIINVLIAVMVFTIPSFARIMRSATLAVKGSLYVVCPHLPRHYPVPDCQLYHENRLRHHGGGFPELPGLWRKCQRAGMGRHALSGQKLYRHRVAHGVLPRSDYLYHSTCV